MSKQKSNDQCQKRRESDYSAEPKRRRLDENEKGSAVAAQESAAEPTSITNLCYELLDRIFGLLDLESLLSVAGSCKRLQTVAAAKFGDDFGKSIIRLSPVNSNAVQRIENYEDGRIYVCGFKYCFPFLRCFGGKILNLDVNYEDSYSKTLNVDLNRYINQYCADSLTSIRVSGKKAFTIDCFANPFKKLTNVRIYFTDLENQLPKFVDWFPNMRRLELRSVAIDENAIAVSFPQLKHLSLCGLDHRPGDSNVTQNKLTTENSSRLLHANPQLSKLRIDTIGNLTFDKILNVFSENSILSELEISAEIDGSGYYIIPEHKRGYFFTAQNAMMLIRKLTALKQFKFHVKNRLECDRLLNQLDSKWKCKQHKPHWGAIEIELSQ